MKSTAKQLVGPTDFLAELKSYETKNRRVLTAKVIQKLELEYNEFVINYFVYHQRFNTVVEYENSFLKLKRWAETWNEEKFDESWVVSRFVAGLKAEIGKRVKLESPDSLQRAIILAKWQELCLVDRVFDKSLEPTAAKNNSEIKKKFAYPEENKRESSMKVNSNFPLSLISSYHASVFAPFLTSPLKNECRYLVFNKMPKRDDNSWKSKLNENGLYWGERRKLESVLLSCSQLLIPCLKNYNGGIIGNYCVFLCMGDVSDLIPSHNDLITNFKSLDEIYDWFALCSTWEKGEPNSIPSHFKDKFLKFILELVKMKITEGGNEVVHLDQACDLYNFLHFYSPKAGITTIDFIHALKLFGRTWGSIK